MKRIFSLFLLCSVLTSSGQSQTEFAVSNNGLIYSEQTILKLKRIVDSLNLKFRNCELHTTYYALEQAKGHYVYMDTGDLKQAWNDIKNGITLQEFIKRYPRAEVDKDLLLIKSVYVVDDVSETEFYTPYLENSHYSITINGGKDKSKETMSSNWIGEYSKETKYSDEWLEAFFLDEQFKVQKLEEKYARLIQYTDCMVDTTQTIFLDIVNAREGVRSNPLVERFMEYVSNKTSPPKYNADYEKYNAEFMRWDSTRFLILDNLAASAEFQTLFNEALKSALKTGVSSEEFEEYVRRYNSAENALQLKRSRIVVGGCSQDDRPRQHALEIAKLSAEAVKWEVFLRAHLDIMNDRFQRVSDGSYAWAGRQTYLKEIEVLDIDVHSLLLGISLRISNESSNHYYGSISRVGRALSETEFPDKLESRLEEMIKDPRLDDYNRLLLYFVFDNYNYNLNDKSRQQKNAEVMKSAVRTLPGYLLNRIDVEKIGKYGE